MAFGDFARLDGYDPDATFPPVRDAFEAAAERLRRGNIRQQAEGAPRAETVMGALADLARPIVETPGRTMVPNPYPPGSELAHAFEDQRSRAANVWAGERATDMIGTGLVAGPKAGAATLGSGAIKQPGIKAYHGSPHDFDRFDLGKIGTGEGAQAYGHGLYFAENEGVARNYRDALAGQVANPARNTEMGDLAKVMSQYAIPGKYRQYRDPRGFEAAKRYDELMQARADDKGHMYEVNLNARPEQFLDWDRPLSQHAPETRSAIEAAIPNTDFGRMFRSGGNDPVGSRVVEFMSDAYGPSGRQTGRDSAAGSAALREAGIPGIRYLDQGSRQVSGGELIDVFKGPQGWQSKIRMNRPNGEQYFTTSAPHPTQEAATQWAQGKIGGPTTSNYVVFDPGIIDILRKYGLAGGAAGFGTLAAQDNYRP